MLGRGVSIIRLVFRVVCMLERLRTWWLQVHRPGHLSTPNPALRAWMVPRRPPVIARQTKLGS